MAWRDESAAPIFVGGDGRSGTTVLAVVLDSHPDIWMGQELHFRGPVNLGPHILEALELLDRNDPSVMGKAVYENETFRAGVQFIRRVRRCGLTDSDLRESISEAMSATGSDLESFDERCALVRSLGEHGARRAGKSRWGFKIMREMKNPTLYEAVFPNACFVHIVRDGRDVTASQMLDHASWGYKSLDLAAQGWRDVVEGARIHAPRNYVEIRFEDMVREPEPALSRVMEGVGVRLADEVLHHHEHRHDFFETQVAHPSREAVMQPLNDAVVGRFLTQLTAEQIREFEATAGDALVARGYPLVGDTLVADPAAAAPTPAASAPAALAPAAPALAAPVPAAPAPAAPAPAAPATESVVVEVDDAPAVIPVDLVQGDLCTHLPACEASLERINSRIVGRFIARGEPFEGQEVAGVLDLRGMTQDDFDRLVKKRYKGNAVREARKSPAKGFVAERFVRKLFLPDLVEINQSKEHRSGGRMKENYLRSLEELGGPPKKMMTLQPPGCPVHYDEWWGVFEPRPGYTQGDVVVDRKLVAYIDLRRVGELGIYSLIIGHGDYLADGVMFHLHFEIMKRILAENAETGMGIQAIMYAGFYQGGAGLNLWKKKAGFSAGLLTTT